MDKQEMISIAANTHNISPKRIEEVLDYTLDLMEKSDGKYTPSEIMRQGFEVITDPDERTWMCYNIGHIVGQNSINPMGILSQLINNQ